MHFSKGLIICPQVYFAELMFEKEPDRGSERFNDGINGEPSLPDRYLRGEIFIVGHGVNELKGVVPGGEFYAVTDAGEGLKYPHNEDRLLKVTDFNGRSVLAVIDGMGGHGSGDVAATLIGQIVGKEFLAGKPLAEAVEAAPIALEKAYQAAVKHGLDLSNRMGATVAGIELEGKKISIVNCGDCKIIGIRNGEVFFETREHNYAQQAFEEGYISSRKETLKYPYRNIISRAVSLHSGRPELAEVERGAVVSKDGRIDLKRPVFTDPVELQDGDIVIGASDRVWDNMLPEEVLKIISGQTSLNEMAVALRRRLAELFAIKSEELRKDIGDPDELSSAIRSLDDNFSVFVFRYRISP
ncbi:MAG: serine/threonine-protein phosphatase [Candidatus Dadabacteria bacterium]|nr:MAG: serine/threonine-protein phosphatase [Candidatus Dadabacteria bacterium]